MYNGNVMERFVLNTDDLDLFVSEQAARLDEDSQTWALRHLRRFLLRDPRVLLEPRAPADRPDVRHNLATARRMGLRPAWFAPTPDVAEEVARVLDWIGALPEIDPRLAGKRDRIPYPHARTHAEHWHARLAEGGRSLGDDDPEGVETVIQLEDGRRWVRLATARALDYEGTLMRNCVGDGAYDRFRSEIYSLRDDTNTPTAPSSTIPRAGGYSRPRAGPTTTFRANTWTTWSAC